MNGANDEIKSSSDWDNFDVNTLTITYDNIGKDDSEEDSSMEYDIEYWRLKEFDWMHEDFSILEITQKAQQTAKNMKLFFCKLKSLKKHEFYILRAKKARKT